MMRVGRAAAVLLGLLLALASCRFGTKRASVPDPPPHPRDHRADEPLTDRERVIAEHEREIDRARSDRARSRGESVTTNIPSPGGLAGAGAGSALLLGGILAGASRDAGGPPIADEAPRLR